MNNRIIYIIGNIKGNLFYPIDLKTHALLYQALKLGPEESRCDHIVQGFEERGMAESYMNWLSGYLKALKIARGIIPEDRSMGYFVGGVKGSSYIKDLSILGFIDYE